VTKKLSKAGDHGDDGTLRCPKCGGTNFTAKRSTKAKILGGVTVGVGALLAPKSRVRCVTCGETFKRG
jgi:DNA-directed RNA polymerase subunit RPC12/RpoP